MDANKIFDEVQLEQLIASFHTTSGLVTKPPFYYQELSARLKQKTLNVQDLIHQFQLFLSQAVMPNAVILDQYINQLLDLGRFKLAYAIYQLALNKNLADKYIFSSILHGMSKMSMSNQEIILAVFERAQNHLNELNEFHYSFTIAALAKASLYDFSSIHAVFNQANRAGKCNRYVFLNFLNALEAHPKLSFSCVYDYWQQYKKQKFSKSTECHNQFLLLFSKFNHVSSQIFDDIYLDAQHNQLANYTTYLRTFLGLLEACDCSSHLFSFYKLINSKYQVPFWVHHRLFSALVKFDKLTAKQLFENLKADNIKETDKKSEFCMEILYILKKSQQIYFNDLYQFHLKAITLVHANSRYYQQLLDICAQSEQINLERVYQIFLESITNSCGLQANFHKVLQMVDCHYQHLNLEHFMDFLLNPVCKPYVTEQELVLAFRIMEKLPQTKVTLEAAITLYNESGLSGYKQIQGNMLNFFMTNTLDTQYARLLKSLLSKLDVKQSIENNRNTLLLQQSTPGQVYFGVMDYLLNSQLNTYRNNLVTIKFDTDLQLAALKKVLSKLEHFIENSSILENPKSVEFTIKSFYNKKYSMGGERSAFSPYVAKNK